MITGPPAIVHVLSKTRDWRRTDPRNPGQPTNSTQVQPSSWLASAFRAFPRSVVLRLLSAAAPPAPSGAAPGRAFSKRAANRSGFLEIGRKSGGLSRDFPRLQFSAPRTTFAASLRRLLNYNCGTRGDFQASRRSSRQRRVADDKGLALPSVGEIHG